MPQYRYSAPGGSNHKGHRQVFDHRQAAPCSGVDRSAVTEADGSDASSLTIGDEKEEEEGSDDIVLDAYTHG
jgi:hypothetical protein